MPDILQQLAQNAVTSGATRVSCSLDTVEWGLAVADNGRGISRSELRSGLPFTCGRSLSLIAEVARVELTTLERGAALSATGQRGCSPLTSPLHAVAEFGSFISCNAVSLGAAGAARITVGTTVCVRGAFSNVPVRQQQLRPAIETGRCIDRLLRLAMLSPHVAFSLYDAATGVQALRLPCVRDESVRFRTASGGAYDGMLVAVNCFSPCRKYRVAGCLGATMHTGAGLQYAYINGRPWVSPQRLLLVLIPLMERASVLVIDATAGQQSSNVRRAPSHLPSQDPPTRGHAVFLLDVNCDEPADCDFVPDENKPLVHFRSPRSVAGALAACVELAFRLEPGALQLLALDLASESVLDDDVDSRSVGVPRSIDVALVAVGGSDGMRSAEISGPVETSWHWLSGSTEGSASRAVAPAVHHSEADGCGSNDVPLEADTPSSSVHSWPQQLDGRGYARPAAFSKDFLFDVDNRAYTTAPSMIASTRMRPWDPMKRTRASSPLVRTLAPLTSGSYAPVSGPGAWLKHRPTTCESAGSPLKGTSRFFSSSSGSCDASRLAVVAPVVAPLLTGLAYAYQAHRLSQITGSSEFPLKRRERLLGTAFSASCTGASPAAPFDSGLFASHRVDRSTLSMLRVVGQLDRKFILAAAPARSSDGSSKQLVIIDQHAADERIRLEVMEHLLFGASPPEQGELGPAASGGGSALYDAFVVEGRKLAISTDGLALFADSMRGEETMQQHDSNSRAACILKHLGSVKPHSPLRLAMTPLEAHTVRSHLGSLETWGFGVSLEEVAGHTSFGGAALLAAAASHARVVNPRHSSSRLRQTPAAAPHGFRVAADMDAAVGVLAVHALPALFDIVLGVDDLRAFIAMLAGTDARPIQFLPPVPGMSRDAELCRLYHLGLKPPSITRILHSKACRGAIMFGTALARQSCVTLLRLLALCSLPFQCAHGRPAILPLCTLLKPEYSTCCELPAPAIPVQP